ncbi:cytochrome P450 [Streptomyces sp. NPDC005533]|uniref:cytochrome P450 n=1 Tax=Streptomyces sp. NPDC005533 TaxID=3364723 RepID=UPI0036BF820C
MLVGVVDQPTELAGYPMRPGHRVAVSPFFIHRDPELYDRPMEFLPDRWLHRSSTASPAKYANMPFGGGPRICLGAHLAMVSSRAD